MIALLVTVVITALVAYRLGRHTGRIDALRVFHEEWRS